MSEIEIEGDLSTADGWLQVMGLVIGEEVMLIPVAGGGNGFQGTLVELIVDRNTGPAVFVIEKLGSPRVSVNWRNCAMVTRAVGPAAPTMSSQDLVKMADENGMHVPDEVRAGIANLES